MKMNVGKKLLCWLMSLAMLLSMTTPALAADKTSVRLEFYGMTAQGDGTLKKSSLSGVFTIMQGDEVIGRLRVNWAASDLLDLPSADPVRVIPDMSTMPEGYVHQEEGYMASIVEGTVNIAPVLVYAPVGLFAVQAESAGNFELLDAQGKNVLLFSTNESGSYALTEAIPAGIYTLRQNSAPAGVELMEDKVFELPIYRGSPTNLVTIDKDFESQPWLLTGGEKPTEEPTAEPTVEPTEEPTEEPTAVPTEEPTAEPTEEPTVEPTEEPTAEPTEEPTAEPTAEPTEEPTAEPTEEPTAEPTEEPTAEPTEEPTAEPTEEPTAEPTEEPTAEPTEEPTAEPTEEPTAEPTEEPTPEPTEEPTPEPTEEPTPSPSPTPTASPSPTPSPEPTPAEGTLRLAVTGDAEASYILAADGATIAAGTLGMGETTVTGVEGAYTMTLMMADDVMLSGLNGQATEQLGQAQWQVAITAGQESLYQLELTKTAAISGSVLGVASAEITLRGERMERTTVLAGSMFALDRLYPDTYEVTVHLPAGDYLGAGWTLANVNGSVDATIFTQLTGGETVTLPGLERIVYSSVSGVVMSQQGTMYPGVTVYLQDQDGRVVAQTATDENGAWRFERLMSGTYVLRAPEVGNLAAADRTVTLDGQDVTDVALVAANLGTLYVSAFIDSNDNGNRGNYEKFLADVVVELYTPGDEPTLVATAVTEEGANEYWAAVFENIPAVEYYVKTILPEGYGYGKYGKLPDSYRTMDNIMQSSLEREQESEVFPLEAGRNRYIGVGALPLCTVTGTVWTDLDGNGLYDEEEPGQAGVEVTLVHNKSGETYSTVTGEDGAFAFGNLRYGKYDMTFQLPVGKMFTRAVQGNKRRSLVTVEGLSVGTASLTLEAGKSYDDQFVGVVDGGGISGMCFQDANYNGVYDEGELPLPGVTLSVTRRGKTAPLATVVSGEDGTYNFGGLRGDTYTVTATLPEDGSIYTLVSEGGNLFAEAGRRQQSVQNIVVDDFGSKRVDVGAVYPASISGMAYQDSNFSGTRDGDEAAVPKLQVFLLDAEGETVAQTTTDNAGTYTFSGLMPGTYTLALNAPSGYAFTTAGEGSVIVNAGNGAGLSEPFEVSLGQNLTDMDMGMILPGTVEGEVFADLNDNGVRDNGEIGLAGAVVRLMDTTGQEAFAATIDTDGGFRFDAVMPGSYYLRYELPVGGIFSVDSVKHEAHIGESETFTFNTGDHMAAAPVGGVALGSISGIVFDDRNADGMMDAEEAPIAGLTLTLTRAGGETTEVVTGDDGAFALENLRPGSYQLTVTYPEGFVSSRQVNVTLPLVPGKTQQTVPLTVAMGDRWADQMLGAVRPATLSGMIWLDANNDGKRDPDEGTPAGERVTVIDQATGEVFAELVTDQNGVFSTEGLVAGLYTVIYRLAPGAQAAKPGDSTFTEKDGMLVMRDLQAVDGGSVDGLLLGVVKLTTISGTVWHDNGEQIVNLAGALITLTNSEGSQVAQAKTGSNGRYAFQGIMPGDYQLSVLLPEGQVVVEPDDARLGAGGRVSVMTECHNREAATDVFTVVMGKDFLKMDIGSVLPGRLGDRVWLDENGNGLQDLDEGGIPNVEVELLRNGEVVATAVTDQYGFYFFPDIYPGVYTLRVNAPDTIKPTIHRTDYPAAASVLMESGESVPVTVPSDNRNYDADMGFVLVTPGVYPAGYGQGATQDWTRIGW